MKRQTLHRQISVVGLTIAALAMGAVVTAQAQLIDDFSGSLSPYTQTIVLAQSSDPAFTFSTVYTGNNYALQVNRPSGTAPQQDLFLRNDYSLTPGYMLSVQTPGGMLTNSVYADFGIVIASQVNPVPAVYVNSNVTTRSNYVNMYFKGSYGTVGTIGFDGTSNPYGNSGLYPTNMAGAPVGYSGVSGLWISEPSTGVYDVGYILASDGSDVTIHVYNFSANTYSGDTSIGNAIGFYADLRAASDTYNGLTDLTLSPIPEPSTMALCGLGVAGWIAWLRRKK